MPESNHLTPDIHFTDAAATKVLSLIEEEQNANLCLRVFITGGGCSGFQYGFTFDEEIKDDDYVLEKAVNLAENQNNKEEDDEGSAKTTVSLLVDCMSYQYLQGAEIDYKEDVNGAQFIIRNPNAKTTCGCGSSFSM
ncbi:MAG: iron-sulfur cluster insertion protein ErpA [Gammaproteobacteria bacterium RIFCSPHIGHO2_12_FULL_41_15]|nr:MAG: iron-sulfur cluster insertion protein ErpA [Gammaproteobacteria bacterium RIFCSPHIGHO2_12_FULL_41_15]